MTPTTADIRRFLVNTFGDEDLKTLCFDYFRDVYDDFTTGMTKGQMIQLLIERCVRRDALANLEAALRAERPDQYVKQFGAPTPRPVSSTIPAEIAPAGRDPWQVFIAMRTRTRVRPPAGGRPDERRLARLDRAGEHPARREVGRGDRPRGLDGSGVFVVALTPAAVGSDWVRNETNDAIELEVGGEVRLIPLDLEACTAPTLWNSLPARLVPRSLRGRTGALLRRLGTRSGRRGGRRRGDKETRRQGDRRQRVGSR